MIREYVTSQYKTNPDKLRLVYRGVDPDTFPYGYNPKKAWLKDWYQAHPGTKNKNILVLKCFLYIRKRRFYYDIIF